MVVCDGFLGAQIQQLRAGVSAGYSRFLFGTPTRSHLLWGAIAAPKPLQLLIS